MFIIKYRIWNYIILGSLLPFGALEFIWLEEWKSKRIENGGRIEKILISFIFVWLRVEKWRDKKVSFYKFTHIPLLKNYDQLKQKSDKQPKKKNAINQFIKKKKIMSQKKIMSS